MSFDLYAPCTCGSGKKLKWCCALFRQDIEKAYQMEQEGQHENALRTIAQVVAAHPGNPEPLGRQAQLLYINGKPEEAEAALQKALDLNPNYPFGLFLQARLRFLEGETIGALLLLRKVAALYDPSARDLQAEVYSFIAEGEMKANRPVAVRAAIQQALRFDPSEEQLRNTLQQFSSKESRYPESARREYTYLPQSPSASADRKSAWESALSSVASGQLADAVKAFQGLTAQDDKDAPAWFNLGLSRAWLGDNAGALEALDRYVTLEADEGKAETAWALAEVLRCGLGMEAQADYLDHNATFEVRDPKLVGQLLQKLESESRLVGAQVQEQSGVLTAVILEKVTALTPEQAATKPARIGAYLVVAGPMFRIWNTSKELFDATLAEVRQHAVGAFGESDVRTGPVQFAEIMNECVVGLRGLTDENEAAKKMTDFATTFLEETWIHRPLKSLSGVPPIDAAGHATLKKKLRGVVKFLQDCTAFLRLDYDFDRLRRKLGLIGGVAPAGKSTGAADLSGLGTADLAALKVEDLADEQLEAGYQAAMKLDARELASRFAQTLVARPANPTRPDRYPYFNQLVTSVLAEGKTDDALKLLQDADKQDGEVNEGRRQNDYGLRRAQIHMRRGELDDAAGAFDSVIARVPTEQKYRGSAAEAMLSAKQPSRAKAYAEAGLAQARQKNDRDSEQYFLELLAAAKKQGA